MNEIKVFAYRSNGIIDNILLHGARQPLILPPIYSKDEMYNIRWIVEFVNDFSCTYSSDILGEKVNEIFIQTEPFVNDISPAFVGEGDFYLDINFPFLEQKHNLTIKVFEDYPVHKYGVFDTVPLPTNMLTIYACFSQEQLVENITGNTKKYFDGYSHLGFFLADLPAMEEIIFKKYGTISLDLVDLFTNTTLIDELFQAKIIMIVWGINPYTYPLYSTSDVQSIKLLLGTEHEKYGIYNIRKDLKTLTLISGHKLREWPNFLKESWPSIPLYGLGEKTLLTPFLLKDKGDNETVIASFLIQRCEGSSLETVPLTNLDLLYK